jgi:hypothetical protein
MGLTNFPNGVSSFGVPVLGGTTGKIFFVHATTGSDGNKGTSPSKPLATINAAVEKCTANQGDIIYLMPGHVEDLADTTTTGAIDLDVAGISLIGLGSGSLQPRIDFNHADSDFFVGADNVTIENVRFHADVTDVKIGINIEDGVDYCTIRKCLFDVETTGTDEFLYSIQFNDASNFGLVEDCDFDMGLGGATGAIGFIKDTDGTTVRNCRIQGDYSTACIVGTTTASTKLDIDGNLLINGNAGNINTEPGIELPAGSTGTIRNNYIVCNLATMVASIVADTCMLFQNYYNEDVNPGTGGLIGTASAND